MVQPTEDEKAAHEEALLQCECVDRMQCHFCGGELTDDTEFEDEEAWADYTRPVLDTPTRAHILAHAYCAQGQIGVERA